MQIDTPKTWLEFHFIVAASLVLRFCIRSGFGTYTLEILSEQTQPTYNFKTKGWIQ